MKQYPRTLIGLIIYKIIILKLFLYVPDIAFVYFPKYNKKKKASSM